MDELSFNRKIEVI